MVGAVQPVKSAAPAASASSNPSWTASAAAAKSSSTAAKPAAVPSAAAKPPVATAAPAATRNDAITAAKQVQAQAQAQLKANPQDPNRAALEAQVKNAWSVANATPATASSAAKIVPTAAPPKPATTLAATPAATIASSAAVKATLPTSVPAAAPAATRTDAVAAAKQIEAQAQAQLKANPQDPNRAAIQQQVKDAWTVANATPAATVAAAKVVASTSAANAAPTIASNAAAKATLPNSVPAAAPAATRTDAVAAAKQIEAQAQAQLKANPQDPNRAAIQQQVKDAWAVANAAPAAPASGGRTMEQVYAERGLPYAIDAKGEAQGFEIQRSTGQAPARAGLRTETTRLPDGGTVTYQIGQKDGKDVVLGADYGVPKQYTQGQRQGVNDDPVASLRRQVSVPPQYKYLADKYIDPGSSQVNPAQWQAFLKDAQAAGLSMKVTSNGLENPYLMGMDNARMLTGDKSVVVNVYNPTTGSKVKDTVYEAISAQLFGDRQTTQVAITTQMREAMAYNDQLARRNGGAAAQTQFIGHSQGTINGNLAISRMSDAEQAKVALVNVGTYAKDHPEGVATYLNVIDKGDAGRFFSGQQTSTTNHFPPELGFEVETKPDTHTTMRTDMASALGPGQTGNSHSLYLYLKLPEVQQALNIPPQPLTASFVDPDPSPDLWDTTI